MLLDDFMDIKQIFDALGIPVSTTIIVILLTFIKIPKIELNIWGMLGKALSKSINAPVLLELSKVEDKVDKVHSDLDDHIATSNEERAKSSRSRILRFSDEIVMGQEHTKEHYEDMLMAIDSYERYCTEHKDFPNSKCVLAIENIREAYKQRLHDNSFVTVDRLVINKKEK